MKKLEHTYEKFNKHFNKHARQKVQKFFLIQY